MAAQNSTAILLCPPLPPVELARQAENVIGRSPGCRFPVSNADASRRHTALVWREGGFVVRDLGSTNGTFVNGERVESERELESGDRIEIGSTVITFCEVEGDLQQLLRGPSNEVTIVRSSASEQQVFEGALDEIPIFAVLQILETGQKSGRLSLSGPEGEAALFIDHGTPTHARTERASGLDAALELVGREQGRFSFEVGSALPERTLDLSMTQLLLEGTRLLDEAGRS